MLLDGTAQANTLAHQLPGKLAGGTPLTIPLISYLGGDVLIKKLEQSLPGSGRGKYVGRSFMWVGCRWSRYCSSRGCMENKWTAILGGLITQIFIIAWVLRVWGLSLSCLMSYRPRKTPSEYLLNTWISGQVVEDNSQFWIEETSKYFH